MNALINKNFLYMRRNLCSSIINFLVPLLISLLVYGLSSLISKSSTPSINIYPNQVISFDPFSFKGLKFEFQNVGIVSAHDTTKFEAFVKNKNVCINQCTIQRYKTIEEFNKAMKDFTFKPIGVVFHFVKEDETEIRVQAPKQQMWYESIYTSVNLLLINPDDEKANGSWIGIQTLIAEYLTQTSPELKYKVTINQRPLYTAPIKNYFSKGAFLIAFPIMLAFMFISIVTYYLNQIMNEKESRLTDLLFRQGITIYSYWISWFVSYLIFSIIPIIVSSIILSQTLFKHVGFVIVFVSLLLFSCNLFGFVFVFQACFKTTKTAQMLINVVYITVLLVSYLVSQPEMSRIAKYFFMIFPQFIQIVNLQILLLLDNYEHLSWSLLNTTYNYVSLFALILIYLFNFAFYIIVGWVIMKVKESGIEKFCQKKNKEQLFPGDSILPSNEDSLSVKININHEEVTDPTLLYQKTNNQVLSIENVSKTYEEVQAVRKFKGDIYSNQIFCLLGHNGAGKTTLIKMISGLEDTDEGEIILDGHSLIRDKDYLYKNIGLCGQEDLFFDYMTVNENLELMCKLKGEKANAQEIQDLLVKIQLIDKKEAIAKTLSGGQKRKLCIALALIGHSKLVLLDEPTSGMDVIAKRFLWDFLKGYKANKIIILTTHSLDEAEYLGDRIGIMSEGQYICSGTSSYLKNKYSCGYNINFLGDSSKFTKEMKIQFVQELKKIDNSSVIKSLSKEVLAVNFIHINENTNILFDQIDKIKDSFFIENYTVSTTSLEDVFLKLNSNELSKDLFQDSLSQKQNVSIEVNNALNDIYMLSGCCSQLISNIKRTILPLWRNKSSFIPELIVSLLIFAIFYILFNQNSDNSTNYQNVNSVLSKNTIYYYNLVPASFNINDLKKNHILTNGITLEQLPVNLITNETKVDQMAEALYKWSEYKYERGVIIIREKSQKLEFNIFYQMSSKNYFFALNNLITSHFMTSKTEKKYLLFSEYSMLSDKTKESQASLDLGMIILSALMLWFSFINFGGFMFETPIRDNVSNLKHLLFLSGANMTYYWFSHLVVDFVKYSIFIIIIGPFLLSSNIVNGLFIFMAIGYIFSSNLMMYCFSFFLNKAENGRQIYLIVMIIGSIGLSIRYLYRVLSNNPSSYIGMSFLKGFIFSEIDLLPASSFLFGMLRVSFLKMNSVEMKDLFIQALWVFLVFIIQMIFFGGILTLLDLKILQRFVHSIVVKFIKDSVTQENQQLRINHQENQVPFLQQNSGDYYAKIEMQKASSANATTAIRGISKTFLVCCCKKHKAVNNLYMGLEANEKFGLLGFNGSGKTTTFKAMTQDILFDAGSMNLLGFDHKTQFKNIRTFIGYCPQENALFDYLTVKETLHFFKALKRLPRSEEEICQQFGLGKYISAYCKNLSGGNKRKLCFAIALMSYPKLLLLDEPSTGVDPESRRVMWKNINDLSKHRSEYNMILSTHSMEEAEILCDTVGWLKKGSFLCVGNPEKLKLHFSNGYKFHIKCIIPAEVAPKEGELTSLNNTLSNPHTISSYTDPEYRAHFYKINSVIETLLPYCTSIQMIAINQDKSIDFNIQLKTDCQGKLFALILTYTKTDKEISEITIDMQSLEKILTSFEGPDGDPNLLKN